MRVLLGAALLSLLGGCGGSDGGSGGSAAIELSVAPNPIQEAPCPPAHCGTLPNQLEAAGTLRIIETAGVGLQLNSVGMALRSTASGTVVAAGQLDSAAISQLAGTARVPSRASLNVPVAVHYDVAGGGQLATLTLVLSGTDDGGHPLTRTLTVPVTP